MRSPRVAGSGTAADRLAEIAPVSRVGAIALVNVRHDDTAAVADGPRRQRQATSPVVVATPLRPTGITGVHTHFHQVSRYLRSQGNPVALVTPFSWGGPLLGPLFGVRLVLERVNGPANTWWYRHWHEVTLRQALRRELADVGDCVVYAQDPPAARAALAVRRSPRQRVVLAVHFRISQSDEWVDKGQIARDGLVYRAIRAVERDVVQRVDGIVYVSDWGREALLSWLPEAADVPSAVIRNFVAPLPSAGGPRERLGDLVTVGNLEAVKNHRYLLHVLGEARRAGRVYTLDVFGEGPERRNLERLARTLGLEGQVRLHGFRTDARERLPGYRAYVHASYSESLPLAVIEAMAAALPVVAADTGGVREIFDDGVEGLEWPLDRADRAAAMLVDLLDDEARRARFAAAALDRFRRDFDADVVAPQLISFLTDPQARGQVRHGAGTAGAPRRNR